MARALTAYSSRNVQVTWNDTSLVGLAPDSAIEISANSDITESEVGMDGFVQHSFLPDDTGTVTLRFLQNSPASIFLQACLQVQKQTGSIYSSAMLVVDPSGAVATMRDVHIQSHPTIVRGSTATGQHEEWVFFVGSFDYARVPSTVAGVASIVSDGFRLADLAKKYLL